MGVILLGKIKIYEIAKKLGLASKEVLEAAEKLNIEVKSTQYTGEVKKMSNGTKAKKWEEEQRQKLEKVYELYGSRMYYRAMQILNQREDAWTKKIRWCQHF